MRKFGSEEWSGLVMVAVAIGVAIPTLFGSAATEIPRGWWIAIFVVFIITLVGASITERLSGAAQRCSLWPSSPPGQWC